MYKIMGQNMKFKKHILHTFILLVLMLSITAISAADLNDTDNTAGDVLTEYDKLIDRQLERAAITCTAGFSKIFPDASKVLTV